MPYPHEPSRALTNAEFDSLRPDFPYVDWPDIYYWGAATPIGGRIPAYNCLAWSLGVQSSWIWPWADGPVRQDQFYQLYSVYGVPQKSGPIDLWGKSGNDMKHGSIQLEVYPSPRIVWYTSKLGQSILVIHRTTGTLSGGIYGESLAQVGPARPEPREEVALGSLLQGENTPQDSGSAEKPTPIIYSLSEEETPALMQQVKKLNQEVKDLFEQKYAAWKQTWTQPAIQASSNPNDYARSQEFNDLVAMGSDILPLLVEKMSNGREFLVLQAVEKLLPSNLIFRPAVDDPRILGGEQLRAHMTAKRWLASL
jgi:hypothetical protein